MKVKQEDESRLVKRQPAKKKKPVIVQAKFVDDDVFKDLFSKEWWTFGKYADTKTALEVIRREDRKRRYLTFRLKED